MNAFAKRYFTWIALIYLAFSLFSYLENKTKIFLFLGFALIFFAVFAYGLHSKNKNLTIVSILLAIAALAANISSDISFLHSKSIAEKYRDVHKISGYVREVSADRDFMNELIVKVEGVDEEEASFDIILVTEFDSELSRGDFFEATVTVIPMAEYSELEYLRNANEYKYPVIAVIENEEDLDLTEGGFRLSVALASLNSKLSARLRVGLGKGAGELASALLLGNRDLLSDSVLRDFRRAGIYHMLALSGLHVAILMGIFELILKKLLISKRVRVIILAILSAFYIALTGFLLSTCRAMLMLWAVYISYLVGRSRDAMTSLFAAVCIIVVIDPASVLDIGLQLSFLSTFGVIASSMIGAHVPFIKNKRKDDTVLIKAARGTVSLLLTSLCVFMSTLPAIAIYFGEVSLATFISNIVAGFLCEAFMVLALAFLAFSRLTIIAAPVGVVAQLLASALTGCAELFSDIPKIMLSLSYPFALILAFTLFGASVIMFGIKLPKKWLLAVPIICFALLFAANVCIFSFSRSDKVTAEYIIGDSIVLSSNDGVYICDISDGGASNFYSAIDLAKANCFTEIDGIILTHYHSDHQRAIDKVSDNFKISRVLAPVPVTLDEWYILDGVARALEDEGVELYLYKPFEELDVLSGELTVTPRAYGVGGSHPSLALSYAYKDSRITFASPPYFSTYLEEKGNLEKYVSECDVLIVGTHGRKHSESFDLFSTLKKGCEVLISDLATLELSDFEKYIDTRRIILGAEYKKYELK